MPNTPAQFPNFDLPGAEWFGLAPNAQIAIQGRRRMSFISPLTTVPPGDLGIAAGGIIETGFLNTSGIYVHDFFVIFDPKDSFRRTALTGLQAGFTFDPAPNNTGYRMGAPPAFGVAPNIVTTIMTDRDKLITGKDVEVLGGAPNNGTLQLGVYAGLLNSDTVNHTCQIYVACVYTRLDGFTV